MSPLEITQQVHKRAETAAAKGGGNGPAAAVPATHPSQAPAQSHQAVTPASSARSAAAVNHPQSSSKAVVASAQAAIPNVALSSAVVSSPSSPTPVIRSSSAKPKAKVASTSSTATSSIYTSDASLAAASGSGNPATTNIIIGVCAAVGSLVVIFFLWRFIHKRRRAAVPLPPVQPLARFREQDRIRQVNSVYRPVSAWNSSTPTDIGSSVNGETMVKSQELYLASQALDASVTRRQAAAIPSPLGYLDETQPEPSSAEPHMSTDSTSSSSKEYTPPPSAVTGARRLARSASQSTLQSTNSRAISYAQSSPSYTMPPRPQSSMTYRGGNTPHSMYGGNFQIVLPAPLAPQSSFSPYARPESPSKRMTMVDAWASRGMSERLEGIDNPFANPGAGPSRPSSRAGRPKSPSFPFIASHSHTRPISPRPISPRPGDSPDLPYQL